MTDNRRVFFEALPWNLFRDWRKAHEDLEYRVDRFVRRLRPQVASVTNISTSLSTTLPKALAGYHDTTHSPLALWQLAGSLEDSSGNGYDLSLDTGSVRYAEMLPGVLGFFFNASTRLTTSAISALQITGDLTVEFLISMGELNNVSPNEPTIVSCDATSGAVNGLYAVDFKEEGGMSVPHEHGSGTIIDTFLERPSPFHRRPTHVSVVRDTTAKTYTAYIDGVAEESGGYSTNPDGAGGQSVGVGATLLNNDYAGPLTLASLKILDRALTAAEVLSEYNRTLGPVYGVLN